MGQKLLSGMSSSAMESGISDDLQETGVYFRDRINDYIINGDARRSIQDVTSYLLSAAKHQAVDIYKSLFRSEYFGGSPFLCLVFLGLFRGAWDATRMLRESYLTLIVAGACAALLSLQFFQQRYLFILLPFLLLWAAKGIVELTAWTMDTRNIVFTRRSFRLKTLQVSVACIVVGALFCIALPSNWPADPDFGGTFESCLNAKRAGLWLKEQGPDDKVVMDAGSAVPYYARAEYMFLPYSASGTALRYIDAKKPDYVVLRGTFCAERPYLQDWMEHGIPGRNAAHLVYEVGDTVANKVQIYQWPRQERPIARGS
jgi:hypothetical protein